MKKDKQFFAKSGFSVRWRQVFLSLALAVPLAIFPLLGAAAEKTPGTTAKIEAEGQEQDPHYRSRYEWSRAVSGLRNVQYPWEDRG